MRTTYKIFLVILPLLLNGCDDYLNVELKQQMTIEGVFSKRATTEQYLAQVYGYLPNEYVTLGTEGSVVPRSDEASFSWMAIEYINFNNGSWGPTNTQYQNWRYCYQGISQATVFIDNVDQCLEIGEDMRTMLKAEARFVRAYLYFTLFRKYGPVYIWGDKAADRLIAAKDVDRHSLDENLDFIFTEYDRAIADLPRLQEGESRRGRITKGAAMAAKSRLALYAARPLLNGSKLYLGLKNKEGNFLFPQAYDASKWDEAAKAAKDVIDMGQYSLYKNTSEPDKFRRDIKSYMGVIFEKWNSEIIWGSYQDNGSEHNIRTAPPRVVRVGYGGFAPSIKLVDTYPMSISGRFPITGYKDNGQPIVDPQSGYVQDGFTKSWTHPLDNFATINAHNSIIGRDARFYASILANGMYWINEFKGQKLVTFHKNGTSNYTESGDCVKVGYLFRRMSDPANNIEDDQWGSFCWPLYRLAEIYLNYAEACNEKSARDESEAFKYLNLVRNRVGLNNIEDAYPEVVNNRDLLRELIQKERMVELAFENQRYYDIRTWMIADKEFNGKRYSLNLLAENYEDSWERTDQVFKQNMVFLPKHYFFPINQEQLNEMVNITQNYGW